MEFPFTRILNEKKMAGIIFFSAVYNPKTQLISQYKIKVK
jgi:hypothetical protein